MWRRLSRCERRQGRSTSERACPCLEESRCLISACFSSLSSSQAGSSSKPNLLQVRTYDCFISYDKHYQTPRFWLLGYDEVGARARASLRRR